jgi:uncharacterized Zn-binding protein involved in type VI secretion
MPPAARVGDMHTCPMVTGVVPHVGGPILPPGCPTVQIGNQFAGRVGDQATCTGPPDVVIKGAATVLIGSMPSARLTDNTAHGGVIVVGFPTVLVGDPGLTATGMSNTYVAYDAAHDRMYVVSYLEYSGPGASAAYASAAAASIEQMWGGNHMVRGKSTTVTVQIHAKVNTTGKPSPGYDHINVDPSVTRSNQTLNGGPGNQNPNDANPGNYVAAHEYGHTLGLNDQYKNTPTGSVPDPTKTSNTTDNIMCQTWPNTTTGNTPHPYQEHYDSILTKFGH